MVRRPAEGGPVWVLEDARRGGGEPCVAIAERLGTEFVRVPLWWGLSGLVPRVARHGSLGGLLAPLPLAGGPPAITLSAGRRSAAVAAWLKFACGSRMVHYGPAAAYRRCTDLHLTDQPTDAPRALGLLGAPHRFSALAAHAARAAWNDRLDHLPHPRLALMVGAGALGGELQPSEAFRLAVGLAEALHSVKGAVLARVGRRVGREATDALAAGLAGCMNLVYREGEPGPDPEAGFLAHADAIVIAGQAPALLLQACALAAPVYISTVGIQSPAQARLQQRLMQAGQIRRLGTEISAWPRTPLDEADRAAQAVRALLDA
jgi:mitochondrial fission protein ELM1